MWLSFVKIINTFFIHSSSAKALLLSLAVNHISYTCSFTRRLNTIDKKITTYHVIELKENFIRLDTVLFFLSKWCMNKWLWLPLTYKILFKPYMEKTRRSTNQNNKKIYVTRIAASPNILSHYFLYKFSNLKKILQKRYIYLQQ